MIVLVSLVDPGLDLDLLPHWIRYYQAAHLDRYAVRLHHKPGVNDEEVIIAQELLAKAGWERDTVQGDFCNGLLQRQVIERIRLELSPGDCVVAVDSDEFQDVSDYREALADHDLVTGRFVDRWDTTLHTAMPFPSLDRQYPKCGNIFAAALFSSGLKNAEWMVEPINQSKVLAFRNRLPVNTQGSHDGPSTRNLPRRLEGRDVHHYSWRRGFVRRMISGKSYFSPMTIASLLKLFSVEPGDPDRVLFQEWVDRRQAERGWVAAA
jgi:hypothetical protein